MRCQVHPWPARGPALVGDVKTLHGREEGQVVARPVVGHDLPRGPAALSQNAAQRAVGAAVVPGRNLSSASASNSCAWRAVLSRYGITRAAIAWIDHAPDSIATIRPPGTSAECCVASAARIEATCSSTCQLSTRSKGLTSEPSPEQMSPTIVSS